MKMVLITYNVVLHDELMELLARLGLESYTRWSGVTGVGRLSGPHLDSHVWPAKNSALAVAADDAKAARLLEEIRRMREVAGREGLKAFAWRLESVT